ncbi:MAG TPA: hypothetical protein VJB13_05070 [Candidatus Nanoarchaeia archaeon]|nr:hypothetical protein [Candidatus Nanoarchaeia archaeon]
MELLGIVGMLLLGGILLLIIKAIIDSIEMVLLILLALVVLVFFFGVSISDITAWFSSQEWLKTLTHKVLEALLFSLRGN